MDAEIEKTAFGPVPSRRLGRSLGIKNILPKTCSYSCVYCQLGRTSKLRFERSAFYNPNRIFRNVEEKVREARRRGEAIDYLTFVPDGEPTLDLHLGEEIQRLRSIGLKIAVITNSSLLWRTDVSEDLLLSDWVSLKVDAVSHDIWRNINRPHGVISLGYYAEFQPWVPIFRQNVRYFSYYLWGAAGTWETAVAELRRCNLITSR